MEILTKLHTFDCDDEEYGNRLVAEQDDVLKANGYENDGLRAYVVLLDNKKLVYTTIDEAIQMLALKNGADLVRFDNGNIGFIGYYNNVTYNKGNCFQIIAGWQGFQEKYGEYLTWEQAEEQIGSKLDKANGFDESIYFDELIYKVNELIEEGEIKL